jgi:hypothetical protein
MGGPCRRACQRRSCQLTVMGVSSCLHPGVSPLLYREAVIYQSPASLRLAAHAGYACRVSRVGRADNHDSKPRSPRPKSAERCFERAASRRCRGLSGSETAGLVHGLGLARHMRGDVYPGWRREARLTPGYDVVRLQRTEPYDRRARSSRVPLPVHSLLGFRLPTAPPTRRDSGLAGRCWWNTLRQSRDACRRSLNC